MHDVISRLTRTRPSIRLSRGVTLVELMIGLVIISVLLAAAGPSFNGMVGRNRMSAQVNDFILAIQTARSEASRMGSPVSIQAVGTDAENEFGEGYCVVVGNPGDCTGTLIRNFDAIAGASLNSIEDVTVVTFDSVGALSGTGGASLQFDLCSESVGGRRIFLTAIGRSKSHAPDDLDEDKRPGC
jgi:type IV fimbrial biogenesis protein FimT